MRKKQWLVAVATALVALAVIFLGPGCGANPLSPTSTSVPSQSAIENAVLSFARNLTGAAGKVSLAGGPPTLSRFVEGPALTTQQFYVSLGSGIMACASGGTLELVGHISGTLYVNGDSTMTLSSYFNIHGNKCLLPGWTMDGDPYVSLNGSFFIKSSGRSSADVDMSRGWTATKDGNSYGCQHAISVDWDTITGGRQQGHVTCGPPSKTINTNSTF